MAESSMAELLKFRFCFDACLAEIGHPPPRVVRLDAGGRLTIKGGPDSTEWIAASIQALRLTASTFEPAARLLEATEREIGVEA